MRTEFFEKGEVDGSDGSCCLKYPNPQGVRYIILFDLIFFITIIRPFMACLVMGNYKRMESYARCRKITFWFYVAIMFTVIFAYVFIDVYY